MTYFYDSLKKTFVVVLRTYAARIPPDGWVLDIGCGLGQLTYHASKQLRRNSVGIDIDAAALQVAVKGSQNATPQGKFTQFDGSSFPFSDHVFDLAFAHEVIEHVLADRDFLVEVSRLLKPGGYLVLSTPNENLQPFSERAHPDHVRHYTPGELQVQLESSGFSILGMYFRRHVIARLIDRLLLGLVRQTGGWREIQPNMRHRQRHRKADLTWVLLRIYQVLVDPIVTWVEQMEFRLMRRHEGPSLICACVRSCEKGK